MIRVTLTDGRTFGIAWAHPVTLRVPETLTGPELGALSVEAQRLRILHRRRWKTVCSIHALVDGKVPQGAVPVARAIASTNYRDTFDKETGRKISLTRALVFTGLSREDRELVWDAYHARPRAEDAALACAQHLVDGTVCECGHPLSEHATGGEWPCGKCDCRKFREVRFDVTRRHR